MARRFPKPKRYRVKNPEKYAGDPTEVWCRSSWETKYCQWADFNDAVVEWSSESVIIPYRHPIDGRFHRYFPDFLIKIRNKQNVVETWLVEIKPMAQVREPVIKKSRSKRYINEVKTYAINRYKWDAAEAFCSDRGWKFIIITERELGL